MERQRPGHVRDAIIDFFQNAAAKDASIADVIHAVSKSLGEPVAESSVRSYLHLNTPGIFERTSRGRYALSGRR